MCSWSETAFPDHHWSNHHCWEDEYYGYYGGYGHYGGDGYGYYSGHGYGSYSGQGYGYYGGHGYGSYSGHGYGYYYDDGKCWEEFWHPSDGGHYCDIEYECSWWCYDEFEMCVGWAARTEQECYDLFEEEWKWWDDCGECDFDTWDAARGGYYPKDTAEWDSYWAWWDSVDFWSEYYSHGPELALAKSKVEHKMKVQAAHKAKNANKGRAHAKTTHKSHHKPSH